ncbi:response regulator [Blautia obeum ATCC 29174]|uniref:response regulator n=1 Tax=Blautia obeum TaxID=40520 RepID=UPI0021A38D7E|nr:response regulator [Blautia obeum]UWO14742.1 response regulator [Blautia obeum ATCC 29174]
MKKSKRAEEKSKKSAEQALKLNQELEEKQQELQNALVEAQSANKAKTSFLNNMSHDIRTPINGIMGMLTILEKSGNDGERTKDCLNKINESSKLLLSLVNDVLDMAKLESDTVVFSDESINLDQVCQEITESLYFQAEEKGLHVIGEHDDYSGIYVWSNAVHLKKILMNLFTNSMKYNKVNGFIYMSMRTIERSEDHMTCEFKIKDNGIGMSEEFIKNELFTPFVQADNSPRSDYNGTGLGMPIVKQLVEKMGGIITVESKLGEGSCFTVILPFKIDTNARPEEKEDFNADISGVRILLVEDNELNAEIAEFMLTENGAKVETVKNGLEAVQHFEASEPGTYDVILMDIMMPVMDGLTATKTIRSLERQDAKTIPIIAMTANAFREDAEKCMEAGMNAHLAKPLDDEKIKQTISEELRKQNACHK